MPEEPDEYRVPDGTIQTRTGDEEEAAVGNLAMLENMDPVNQRCAYTLLVACGDFIETLLQISAAEGPDREDTLDRACACIRHNQQLAHTVLRRYGFRPMRALIDE